MALPKRDTRALVRDAASRFSAEGTKVSVRAVRQAIGRGSDTTIATELRAWREERLRSADAGRASSFAPWGELPPALLLEAQTLYLRVLGIVSERFSEERAVLAASVGDNSQQTLVLLDQIHSLTDFSISGASKLAESVEERAALSAQLLDRDHQVAELSRRIEQLSVQLARLSEELTNTKLASAEREAQAFVRADSLSKHLLKMTDEQRLQLAAPLAGLRERYETLQTHEGALSQAVNKLREENAELRGRLATGQLREP